MDRRAGTPKTPDPDPESPKPYNTPSPKNPKPKILNPEPKTASMQGASIVRARALHGVFATQSLLSLGSSAKTLQAKNSEA